MSIPHSLENILDAFPVHFLERKHSYRTGRFRMRHWGGHLLQLADTEPSSLPQGRSGVCPPGWIVLWWPHEWTFSPSPPSFYLLFLRQHRWCPPRVDNGWLGGHPGTLALGHWLFPQLCLPSIYQEGQPVPEWAGTWSPESWVGHKRIEGSKGKQALTYHLHKGYWRSFCSTGLHRFRRCMETARMPSPYGDWVTWLPEPRQNRKTLMRR